MRGLEKLWAMSLRGIEGLEGRVLGLLEEEGIGGAGDAEGLQEVWKGSEVFGAVERLLAGGEVGDRERDRERERRDGSEEGDMSTFSDLLAGQKRKRIRLDVSDDVHGNGNGMIRLEFPPDGPQMLEMYFAYTHTWFPVLAKHAVLRTSYLYANNPIMMARTTPGSGDHAVLWAVVTYIATQNVGSQSHGRVMEFYNNARGLVPTEKERFELGHVQALLLLTLVNIGLGDWTAAWLLSGQATSLTTILQSDPSTITSTSPSQTTALILGCFVVDTILSVRLNRTPHLHPKDLLVPFLEEDGLEEWSAWVDLTFPSNGEDHPSRKASVARGPSLSRSFFNRLVELAMLLNKISRQDTFDSSTSSFCQSTLKDMQAWCSKIPPVCRLGDIGLQAMQKVPPFLLPHQTYVCLTHIATISLLYTRFASHLQNPSSTLEKALQLATVVTAAHAKNFGQIVLPPIFEFALRTVVDGARFAAVDKARVEEQAQLKLWVRCVGSHASKLGRVWPVMVPLLREMNSEDVSASWPMPNQQNQHQQQHGAQGVRGGVSWPAAQDSLDNFQLPLIDGDGLVAESTGQNQNDNDSILEMLGLDLGVTPPNINPSTNAAEIPPTVQPLDFIFHNAHWPSVTTPASQPLSNTGIPAAAPVNSTCSPRATQKQTPATPDSLRSNSHQQLHSQNQRPKRPAPNDIEAIFDDVDMDADESTSNSPHHNHHIPPRPSPTRGSTSASGSEDDTVPDAGSKNASNEDVQVRVLSPPDIDIADIWPPPGFFPDDGEDTGAGAAQGEKGLGGEERMSLGAIEVL